MQRWGSSVIGQDKVIGRQPFPPVFHNGFFVIMYTIGQYHFNDSSSITNIETIDK